MSSSVVNTTNKNGATPILIACKNARDNLSPVKKLLMGCANPTITDKSQATCIHAGVASRNMRLCKLLLAHVTKHGKDNKGKTPLHLACQWAEGSLGVIRLLLEHGANVNAQDAECRAPLHEACAAGCVEAVELLLGWSADVRYVDVNGRTVSS